MDAIYNYTGSKDISWGCPRQGRMYDCPVHSGCLLNTLISKWIKGWMEGFTRIFYYLLCVSLLYAIYLHSVFYSLDFIITYLSIFLTSLWRSRLEFLKDQNIFKSNMSTTEANTFYLFMLYPVFPIFVNNTINSQSPKWYCTTQFLIPATPIQSVVTFSKFFLFQFISVYSILSCITLTTLSRSLSDFYCATYYLLLLLCYLVLVSHFQSLTSSA